VIFFKLSAISRALTIEILKLCFCSRCNVQSSKSELRNTLLIDIKEDVCLLYIVLRRYVKSMPMYGFDLLIN